MQFSKATLKLSLILVSVICLANGISAKVILPPFFSDNMVLQQKDNAAIWGKAAATTVTIMTSWNNKTYTVKTDTHGEWMTKVVTPVAGGPYEITFDDGDKTTLRNVLIGEVWICSGQSNMEMPLAGWGKINNYQKEIADANYASIRLLQIEKLTSTTPQKDVKVEGGGWRPCSPETVAGFSSVAYFFARNIYQSTHIPIGLIHTSWGGTIAEAWVSGTSLKTMADFKPAVEKMEAQVKLEAGSAKDYQQQLKEWQNKLNTEDAGYKDEKAVFAAPDLNNDAWKKMKLPTLWEDAGLAGFDGVVWFRKTVSVPESLVGKELTLHLGTIDDNDITWFNGVQVGKTEGYNTDRIYQIPAKLVTAGANTIAVRVYDGNGGGGIYGDSALSLKAADGQRVMLSGDWSYSIGVNVKDLPPQPASPNDPNRPIVLFNAMINPFIPYAIRGAIWYQGESNAGRAYQYRELFPLLISDWRQKWGRGDFPFYFVQLANYTQTKDEPAESDWAELREAQSKTLSLPNTGMAVIIDIGEAKDIHPKNKQDVGKRLALIARANIYDEKITFSGPVYQSFKKEGSTIRLSFKDAEGLRVKGGNALKGFAIAGIDKKFYWAEAKIEGNEVVVSSPNVADPIAVRYGWANNPICNLYNQADLPASPFRTDDWDGVTKGAK